MQYTGFCVPDLIHYLRKDKADSRTAMSVLRGLVASPSLSLHPTHRVFSHDVTEAMLVYQNKGTADIMVYRANLTSCQQGRLQQQELTGNFDRWWALCSRSVTWYKRFSHTGLQVTHAGTWLTKSFAPFKMTIFCLSCPSALLAAQHGVFVPRNWPGWLFTRMTEGSNQ